MRRHRPGLGLASTTAVTEESGSGDDVSSELGDSYVREVRPSAMGLEASAMDDGAGQRAAVDELANGGVMGLLTEIYDRRRAVL